VSKASRRVYDPNAPRQVKRKFEWVETAEGDICVWSMNVAESLTLTANSMRPPEWPGSPVDETAAILWQVMLTCHDDEPPHGQRIFQDHMADKVTEMPHADFRKLMQAIGRVNGTGDDNLEGLNTFFQRESAGHKLS
jgi:hypothetical protein